MCIADVCNGCGRCGPALLTDGQKNALGAFGSYVKPFSVIRVDSDHLYFRSLRDIKINKIAIHSAGSGRSALPRRERAPDTPTCWACMETAPVFTLIGVESLEIWLFACSSCRLRFTATILIELFEAQRTSRTSSRTYRTCTQKPEQSEGHGSAATANQCGRAVDHDEMHKWQKYIYSFYRCK